MAVDDAVDFVGAGSRLVDALRKGRDDALRALEELIEIADAFRVDAADPRNRLGIRTEFERTLQRLSDSRRVGGDEFYVGGSTAMQM